MHFQGQNLNFLVKILIFYQKYATSNVQIPFYLVLIFAGFLLFFGQKNGKRQNGKNGKKNPANGKRQTANGKRGHPWYVLHKQTFLLKFQT